MRSSPKFLVASRSGKGEGQDVTSEKAPERVVKLVSGLRSGRPDRADGIDADVRLKVGFKTILLVAIVFDLINNSTRELLGSTWIEKLLGL